MGDALWWEEPFVPGRSMPADSTPAARFSRRTLLQASAGLGVGLPAVLAADAWMITPRWLTTTSVDMPPLSPPPQGKDAPPAATLMQLSDLHMRQLGSLETQLLDAVHASLPDLLLFTGDAFDTPQGLDVFAEFLAACPTQSMPLGILGNWEYRSGVARQRIATLYEQHGGRLLVNESLEVTTPHGSLVVTGLDDLVQGRPQQQAATRLSGRSPHLLLAHCPGQRDRLEPQIRDGIDLILAGHTHGGQIAPFGMALVTPPGSGRYVRGWYREDGPAMYVSRGLGTSTLPIRLGVTPELVTIRWPLA